MNILSKIITKAITKPALRGKVRPLPTGGQRTQMESLGLTKAPEDMPVSSTDMPVSSDVNYTPTRADQGQPMATSDEEGMFNTAQRNRMDLIYGNDIDENTNPIEAGLGWITKLNKSNFIGKNILVDAKENSTRKLICFEMIDRGIPRKGYPIKNNGDVIGVVTSGTQSPSLKQGIGLGFVKKPFDKNGTDISVEIRGKDLKCNIVKPPLYKNGTSNA